MINKVINKKTKGFNDIINITNDILGFIEDNNIDNGLITISISGSTAGITTIEYEDGVIEDLKKAFERIAPQSEKYLHNEKWGDGNGFSHVRSAILGPSLSFPIINKEIKIGVWQQIVLVDFDNKPRERSIYISCVD